MCVNSSIRKLVFATNNRHKAQEIKNILKNQIEILSLGEIGFYGEIPEEQNSLEGNAEQKAFYIYNYSGIDCFADDTGLEIEALNGEPGVYSARYAGENCTYDDNMNLVLLRMNGLSNRKACFRTVIALVEKGRLCTFEGRINGRIIEEKRGSSGFGYDPIFIPDGFDQTFAEMTPDQKNAISHRAMAIKAFTKYIFPDY
jgi:XTP/dITP diphosphohydrolase